MLPLDLSVLGLSRYEVTSWDSSPSVIVRARYVGDIQCPSCHQSDFRRRGSFLRRVRHIDLGSRFCWLEIEAGRFECRPCGRRFNQRFPGILPGRRTTEAFRRQIVGAHHRGVPEKTLSDREHLGHATIERWYHEALERFALERSGAFCPKVLGIDEHFFTRRQGFATTFCDLEHHRVFDLALGRSEEALKGYFHRLPGKRQVRVVSMDLSGPYRALVRKYMPQAAIVADRFHVIRLVGRAFLRTWKRIDPAAKTDRELSGLLRRHSENLSQEGRAKLATYLHDHPAIAHVYTFKQELTRLLLIKHRRKRDVRHLIPRLRKAIQELRASPFPALSRLGRTLSDWMPEIARMWRYTRNNGTTEGFHTKMEMIQRRAFGFRNFENYKLRVKVLCAN